MSSLTTSQRQQRLSNVLLAGNLYKAHKIGKQLTQITALHKMSLGVSIANLKVNAQVLSSIRSLNQKMDQQEAEKRKIKLLKDIFFQITEEIEEIEGRKTYPLEKYFLFLSLKAEMKKNEIDTSLADDLSEKKMISSTIKKLNKQIENLDKKFSKKEKDDQEQILSVLEVDEESEITNLDNNLNSKTSNLVKDFKKEVTKEINEKYSTPNYKKTEFFEDWGGLIYRGRNKIKEAKKRHVYFDKFIRIVGYSDFVEDYIDKNNIELFDKAAPNLDPYLNPYQVFWNEIATNILKKTPESVCKKINHDLLLESISPKVSLMQSMKSDYKNMVKEVEKKMKRKVKRDELGREYFYYRNKKLIDEVIKIVLDGIQESFKNKQNARSKEKETVKKLKGNIQKEKDLVKQIYKKHKFVNKIIASRI